MIKSDFHFRISGSGILSTVESFSKKSSYSTRSFTLYYAYLPVFECLVSDEA